MKTAWFLLMFAASPSPDSPSWPWGAPSVETIVRAPALTSYDTQEICLDAGRKRDFIFRDRSGNPRPGIAVGIICIQGFVRK